MPMWSQRAKDALSWDSLPRPLITMHVRGGDSCLKREQLRMARACHSLADYMPHAVRARRLYGARTIFLATDGAEDVLPGAGAYLLADPWTGRRVGGVCFLSLENYAVWAEGEQKIA